MVPVNKTPFSFVSSSSGQQLSTREKELERARIRSHAATIAHKNALLKQASRWQERKGRGVLIPLNDNASRPTKSKKKAEGSLPVVEEQLLTQSPPHTLDALTTHEPELFIDPSLLWSTGMRRDPFNCLPGGNEPHAATAVDFLLQIVRFDVGRMTSMFSLPNHWGSWLLEYMSSQPDLFYTVVASMAVMYNQLYPGGHIPPSIISSYKLKALEALRNRLSQPGVIDDETTLMTMSILAMEVLKSGDCAAYSIHRKNLKAVISKKGGLNCLSDRNIRALVAQSDVWRAIEVDDQSHLVTYPEMPLTQGYQNQASKLPRGFQELALQGLLSKSTTELILNVHEARRGNFQDFNPDDPNFYDSITESCPALTLRDPITSIPTPEALICIATFPVMGNDMKHYSFNQTWAHYTITVRLARRFPYINPPIHTPFRNALLWVCLTMITSCCDATNIYGPSKVALKMLMILQEEKFPETRRWSLEQYNAFAYKFFWSEVFAERLRPLKEALDRAEEILDSSLALNPLQEETWSEKWAIF